jgi:hypothetical protein
MRSLNTKAKGWLLSTSDLALLIGLEPSTVVKHEQLSRWGFIFLLSLIEVLFIGTSNQHRQRQPSARLIEPDPACIDLCIDNI